MFYQNMLCIKWLLECVYWEIFLQSHSLALNSHGWCLCEVGILCHCRRCLSFYLKSLHSIVASFAYRLPVHLKPSIPHLPGCVYELRAENIFQGPEGAQSFTNSNRDNRCGTESQAS